MDGLKERKVIGSVPEESGGFTKFDYSGFDKIVLCIAERLDRVGAHTVT